MSRLGQQMFFARKRSGSSTDVGHKGVITGCDVFSLRSLPARSRVSSVTLIPKELPSLHSNQLIHATSVLTK
ncbi:hypothetical protein [Lysinibacillus xylanilyticus]|uniref:hypothetical protein n=1 Tax=Lysinibacillus xylanilyticus TaxID=582475 RepID=UPI0010636B48|nr:hypothetical protein [Lysinibacillus xylanilyticus]